MECLAESTMANATRKPVTKLADQDDKKTLHEEFYPSVKTDEEANDDIVKAFGAGVQEDPSKDQQLAICSCC
jgi:hypothetical protein